MVLLQDPNRLVMLKQPVLRSAITTFPATLLPPRTGRRPRGASTGLSSTTSCSVVLPSQPSSADDEKEDVSRNGEDGEAQHSSGTVPIGGHAMVDVQGTEAQLM